MLKNLMINIFLKKFFVKIGFILNFFHNFATPKH